MAKSPKITRQTAKISNMTKDQLKDLYNAPREENFATEAEYLAAKALFKEENPEKYEEILAAPE